MGCLACGLADESLFVVVLVVARQSFGSDRLAAPQEVVGKAENLKPARIIDDPEIQLIVEVYSYPGDGSSQWYLSSPLVWRIEYVIKGNAAELARLTEYVLVIDRSIFAPSVAQLSEEQTWQTTHRVAG